MAKDLGGWPPIIDERGKYPWQKDDDPRLATDPQSWDEDWDDGGYKYPSQ